MTKNRNKNIILYTLFFYFSCSSFLFAQNNSEELKQKYFLLIGGSGEDLEIANRNEHTTFDAEYLNLRKYLNQAENVTSEFKYDGEYKSLKELNESINVLKKWKTVSQESGTSREIKSSLNKLKNAIEQGDITKGQQIIVYISSHGSENNDSQKTHSISVVSEKSVNQSQNNSLSELDDTLDIDSLIPLVEAARKEGVLLGIVDTSCYAGDDLLLANETTCVITGSSASLPTKVGFAHSVSEHFIPGRSLEEVFLKTRDDITSSGGGDPQISTTAGIEALALLNNLRPYFKNARELENSFVELASVNSDRITCNEKSIETSLDTFLQNINRILSSVSSPDTGKLKNAIKSYQNQLKITQDFFNIQLLEGRREISSGGRRYHWNELDKVDLEKTYDKISTGFISLSFGKKTKEETLQDVKNLMVLQKETLISSEYAKYLEHKENYKVALQQVLRMANEVISEERETYKILYKNSKSTKRNPCKEIFL